jgi:Domain of unknown function (DUF4365)
MAYPKRRIRQHIMEDRSIRIVRDVLPDHWVIREYKPDYGIDLTIELFEFLEQEPDQAATLGETLFVQVKSTEVVDARRLRVHARRNVEKGPLVEHPAESVEVEVAALKLETSELLAVQAIGSAIPVLLFLVELSTRRIYFVCLNDLIEKVILPQNPDYHQQQTRVVHIPLQNCISADRPHSHRPLGTYAKRPKLYAAFEKFAYQAHELEAAVEYYQMAPDEEIQRNAGATVVELLRHFLAVIRRYDFWDKVPEWQPIAWSYAEVAALHDFVRLPDADQDLDALRDYLLNQPGIRRDEAFARSWDLVDARLELYLDAVRLWGRLRNLGGIYEELVREWFLPTHLSATALTEF